MVDGADVARARELLDENLDWDFILRSSQRHGVAALVYRTMNDSLAGVVPEERLAQFRESYRHNAARGLFLTSELLTILERFAEHDISAIPYKGPALAVKAYGDASLRSYVDLDILVRKRDVRRASAVLAEMGYDPHFKISAEQEPAFLRLSYVQLFTRGDKRTGVELHWNVAPRFFSFALDADELWERLEVLMLGGVRVNVPASEDMILTLCVHAAKDLWERLEWVCSIASLARAKIDWELLLERARRCGAERMVLLGLWLAQDLFQTRLPDVVKERLSLDRSVEKIGAGVRERLFDESIAPPRGLAPKIAFHLKLKERASDKLRYCFLFAATTTPVDWAEVSLPKPLGFIYYFLRPYRLVKKYVLSPSKSLR